MFSRSALLLTAFSLLMVLPVSSQAQKFKDYTLIPDETGETTVTAIARIAQHTGLPLTLYSVDYKPESGTPEEMARAYFRDRGEELGMTTAGADLVLQAVREMPSGYRVRFTQEVNGIPVYRSGVNVVLDRNGAVRFVSNGYKGNLNIDVRASKTGGAQAITAAKDYLEIAAATYEKEELVIYAPFGAGRLAHKVDILTSRGGWEILVDAGSGDIFRSEPTTHISPPSDHNSAEPHVAADGLTLVERWRNAQKPLSGQRVDGSGWVFDPDPVSSAGMAYGDVPGLLDNDNADSDFLTSQLKEVVLRDITLDGSTYRLEGPNAVVAEIDGPNRGTFAQDSSNFHFTRSQPAFEAVNVYYHIDASMRYINETLGVTLSPIQYEGGVRVDPHALQGDANAIYSSDLGILAFGEGGVDSAEDAAIILHELGHGIHDWVTNGNLGRTDGLSEGSSDYWASSYIRSLGLFDPSHEQYNQFGRWGLKPLFGGRQLDYFGRFPIDLTGAIHTDGQIWSSAVMSVWNELGQDTTDKLFLEALSMLGTGSNTEDAARAIVLADTLLNGAANAQLVLDKMTDRGFIFRPAMAGLGRSGQAPLTVNFIDLSVFAAGGATAWNWDYESDGIIDETSRSASNTYTEPGLYSVSLTASAGGPEVTTTLTDYVSVNGGVYVWEGTGDTSLRSGRFIADLLESAGVTVRYSRTPVIHPNLEGYDAVFLSFGPYSPQSPPIPFASSAESSVRRYINAGGHVYLEGGDTFGFDQGSNSQIQGLFGMDAASDGIPEAQPVNDLRGQSGSIVEGLSFSSSNQSNVTWIDDYTVSSSGRAMFTEDSHNITVGVQHENSSGSRTVAMAYTLQDLVDGGSSRTDVLQAVVDYFGLGAVITDTEQVELPTSVTLSPIYPNPFSQTATMSFELPQAMQVHVEMVNMLGQRIAVLMDGQALAAGSHELTLDGTDLPSGMYFVSLQAGAQVERMPVVLVR